jgi:hypothetical protein
MIIAAVSLSQSIKVRMSALKSALLGNHSGSDLTPVSTWTDHMASCSLAWVGSTVDMSNVRAPNHKDRSLTCSSRATYTRFEGYSVDVY